MRYRTKVFVKDAMYNVWRAAFPLLFAAGLALYFEYLHT
jgi:hypothetical protein